MEPANYANPDAPYVQDLDSPTAKNAPPTTTSIITKKYFSISALPTAILENIKLPSTFPASTAMRRVSYVTQQLWTAKNAETFQVSLTFTTTINAW